MERLIYILDPKDPRGRVAPATMNRAEAAGQFEVRSRGGIPRADRLLLSELSGPHPQGADPFLDIGSRAGAAAIAFSRLYPGSWVEYCHYDIRMSGLAARCCSANGLEGVEIKVADFVPPGPYGRIAFVTSDFDPRFASEVAEEAVAALAPGGVLYVAGRSEELVPVHGALGYLPCLAEKAAEAGGVAVLKVSPRQAGSRSAIAEIKRRYSFNWSVTMGGKTFSFRSAPGVFSPEGLDAGTRLLIETLEISRGQTLLDLGCGLGSVGIIAAATTGCEPYFVDISARAVALATENARANGLARPAVAYSDAFSLVSSTFDVIATNPPYHEDYCVAQDFIEGAASHLKMGGRLHLVAKRAGWYQRKMRETFGGVRKVEQDGYTVLISEKRGERVSGPGRKG